MSQITKLRAARVAQATATKTIGVLEKQKVAGTRRLSASS